MNIIQKISIDLNVISRLNSKTKLKYSETMALARKVVQALAKKHHVKNFKGLLIDENNFFSVPHTALGFISIPHLYLINRQDIPFTGPNDPKLFNIKNIQAFANSVADQLHRPHRKVKLADMYAVQKFLQTIERPDQASKGVTMVLLHELGHIKLNHKYHIKMRRPLYVLINVVTLGIFGLITRQRLSRKHEKEADLFACKHSKEVLEGGAYYFEMLGKMPPKHVGLKIFHTFLCATLRFSHGSFSSRALRFKQEIAKINSC